MIDRTVVRKWVLDANDGIISTTGIMQGFAGAGADSNVVLFAAMAIMVTGGLSLGGALYAEAAQDREAELEIIAQERRKLALSPDEQHAELRQHYEGHGLDAELAERVAAALMSKSALAAQLETEHGMIEDPTPAVGPWGIAIRGFLGFVSGALPTTVAVLLLPDQLRLPISMIVVVLSLSATGLVSAYAGAGKPMRAVFRSVAIGAFVGLLSFAAGNVFELIGDYAPQLEIDDHDGG